MDNDVLLEIFKMPSDENEFYESYPFLNDCREFVEASFKASSRRKEILSEKIIINKIFGGADVTLSHDENGKPLLNNGYNISISHTRNYLAVMVSDKKDVALDIEHITDRVRRVGRMFLLPEENVTETQDMLVIWCVKETMYKLFSSQHLTFTDIRVKPFIRSEKGVVCAENLRTKEIISLNYVVTHDYVMTTAYK